MFSKKKTISKGFLLAGLMNLSILINSRLFTNTTIPKFDPEVMSNFGLLMIVVWGLAYISVSDKYHSVKWLVAIFAIEKLIYGVTWIKWIMNNSVADVYQEDKMAGMFYSVYGINDLVFCVFFAVVFISLVRPNKAQ